MLKSEESHCGFPNRCFCSENRIAVFEVDASIPKMAPRFSRSMLPFRKWHCGFRDRSFHSENGPAVFPMFGLRQNNVLVSKAGVPASPLIRNGRIYAEVNDIVNTGLAIANPNGQSAPSRSISRMRAATSEAGL
jgi:hypothetical protein